MIQAHALSKRFGSVHALRGVDLWVPSGSAVGVMGANGSGKSTLLKLVAGLLRPTSGSVTMEGKDPRQYKPRIGYIGHDSYLYPHLSTAENLRFYATLYSADPNRIDELVAALDLSSKRDALINTMSRGQVQRVAIARALLHDPDLLILDEPFNGLDADSSEAFRTLLKARPRTMLIVAHDEDALSSTCDTIITIDGGRRVNAGPS